MKYVSPVGAQNPDASYINGNPGGDVEGSPVPAEAIEHTMREVVHVIEASGLIPDGSDLTQLLQAIKILSGNAPAGAMCLWPSQTLPLDGKWLERDGSILSVLNYPDLFAVLGFQFGGNGTTTFALPDDRGLFERAWDHGRNYDSGRVFGSYQVDSIKAHTHTVSLSQGIATGSVAAFVGGNYGPNPTTTSSNGGAETTVKNRAYLPIIKVLP